MIVLVQTTFPSGWKATRIGRVVMEERLAACVNIIDGCRSLFRWQGIIEDQEEALAQFKTAASHREALVRRLVELHPYDLPVVDYWEVSVDGAAQAWVLGQLN